MGKLKNDEIASYELPTGEVELKVGFAYIKSHPLMVQDGQTILAKGSIMGSCFWIFGLKSSYLEIEE